MPISGKGDWPIRSALTHGVSAFYRNRTGHSEQAIVTDLFFGSTEQTFAELSTTIEGECGITATLTAAAQLSATIEGEFEVAPSLTTDTQLSAAIESESEFSPSLMVEAQLSTTADSEFSINAAFGEAAELSTTLAGECELTATMDCWERQSPVLILPRGKPRNRVILERRRPWRRTGLMLGIATAVAHW